MAVRNKKPKKSDQDNGNLFGISLTAMLVGGLGRHEHRFIEDSYNQRREQYIKMRTSRITNNELKTLIKDETKNLDKTNSKTKKKPAVKKETPHQIEVRELKEKNKTQRTKITALNKQIKALKSENTRMRNTGIFPDGISQNPNKKKRSTIDRFSQVE